MAQIANLTLCLWFDHQAWEASNFYCSIFKDSKVHGTSYYPESVAKTMGLADRTVMAVEFEINGMRISAINGGPRYQFTEAMSIIVKCEDQAEIDYFWDRFLEDTDPEQGQCGWIKDKFGIAWQIIPARFDKYLSNPDPAVGARVFQAMMPMKKLDLQKLQNAYDGVE